MSQHIFDNKNFETFYSVLKGALNQCDVQLIAERHNFNFQMRLEEHWYAPEGSIKRKLKIFLLSDREFILLTPTITNDNPDTKIVDLVEKYIQGSELTPHTVLVYFEHVPNDENSRITTFVDMFRISADAQKKLEEIISIKRGKLDRYAKVKVRLSELEDEKAKLEEELKQMTPRPYDLEPDELGSRSNFISATPVKTERRSGEGNF